MTRTGILFDPIFLEHDTGPGHPERRERLVAVAEILDVLPADRFPRIDARDATDEELLEVHTSGHLEKIRETESHTMIALDADTRVCARSHAAARRASGGTLALLEAIAAGRVRNGFAAVRPPGHHAETDRAMGFCLFNNVAVAARAASRLPGIERVLVLDWDVHHGNGTQHLFDRDPNVLFVSTHQYPFYPGTGASREVGAGEGEGTTLNLPFPAGYGDHQYATAFLDIVEPVARAFDPDFVLVSAGFDAHARDPLAGMEVTEAGYRAIMRSALRVARDHCDGRLLAVLEGGYDLVATSSSVAAVLDEMARPEETGSESPPGNGEAPDLRAAREIARHYWGV